MKCDRTMGPSLWLFSQEPGKYGGAESVVNEVVKLLESGNISWKHAWVTRFSSMKYAREGELQFRALPLPAYVNSILAGIKLRSGFKRQAVGLVVGGSPTAGGIAYGAGLPYGMWIGTTLMSEYRGREFCKEFTAGNSSIAFNRALLFMNRYLEKCVLRKARFIVTQSLFMAREIEKEYSIPSALIDYIPYPMKVMGGKNRGWRSNGPRLLAVGRVDDRRKNFGFLLKAFTLIKEEFRDSQLRIVGEVSAKSWIFEDYDYLLSQGAVKAIGVLSEEDLMREYEWANIFVLSPTQEGLGIVFLEAMAHGLPVVTTTCGGPEGIIIDGVNGYLVPKEDPMAFKLAVKRVWNSASEYTRMCGKAREYIIANHNDKRFAKLFLGKLKDHLGVSLP
jgi:glycosyltransferase involved in cell wall biosynthesis